MADPHEAEVLPPAAPRDVPLPALIVIAVVVAIAAAVFVYVSLPEGGLAKCDEAIQATLNAPSTYRRISDQRFESEYYIEYDAENAFGVPLRGTGVCRVYGEQASWSANPS